MTVKRGEGFQRLQIQCYKTKKSGHVQCHLQELTVLRLKPCDNNT